MDKNQINQILEVIFSIFGKISKKEEPKAEPVAAAAPVIPIPDVPKRDIDWSNPKAKINDRFSVGEALTLPSWNVMHVPSEDEKRAIINIADGVSKAAEVIEKEIGKHAYINVHAFIRPEKANIPGSQWDGKDYNRYIYETQVWKDLTPEEKAKKTVPKSPHRTGRAIDFHIVGFEGKDGCAKIRKILEPQLDALQLRMEDISGGWVHLDDMPVINKRFFKP